MTLPIILEVAISLTFVYLILSLLVSGFQEIIAILLQSRAKRLWVSLINLISIDDERSQALKDKDGVTSTTQLINTLYDNVLIQNLNQDAQRWFHKVRIPYINLIHSKVFREGHASGPSYLPAETFATTLLKTLGIAELSKSLSDARLNAFFVEQLERIEDLLPDVSAPEKHKDFEILRKDVAQLITDYTEEKISLAATVKSILDMLLLYLSTPENGEKSDFPHEWYALETYFTNLSAKGNVEKDGSINEDNFTLLLRKFTANPLEIIQALKKITDRTAGEIDGISTSVDAIREFSQLVKGLSYLLRQKQQSMLLEDGLQEKKDSQENQQGLETSNTVNIRPFDLEFLAQVLDESLEKKFVSELIQIYRALNITNTNQSVETLLAQSMAEKISEDELCRFSTGFVQALRDNVADLQRNKPVMRALFQEDKVFLHIYQILHRSRNEPKFQRRTNYIQRADGIAELIQKLQDETNKVDAQIREINAQVRALNGSNDEQLKHEAKLKETKTLLTNLTSILHENESTLLLQLMQTVEIFQRIKSQPGFEAIDAQFQAIVNMYVTEELLYGEIGQAIHRLGKTVNDYKKLLPRSLVESLDALVDRVRINSKNTEIEIRSLQQEIEVWFDRAMDRATGVYKRNSKGVAFLLGMIIAFAINADTFHLFGQLSKDTNLRTIVTQRAIQSGEELMPSPAPALLASPNDDLIATLEQANQAFAEIPLPIGWNYNNVKQQLCPSSTASIQTLATAPLLNAAKQGGKSGDVVWFWETPFGASGCAGVNRNWGESIWVRLKMLVGWFLTAGAIAMGAPFWFELMSQLINIRGTGKPPKSSS